MGTHLSAFWTSTVLERALHSESGVGDEVLQAARAVVGGVDVPAQFADRGAWLSGVQEKQQPLVPLLLWLLDAAETVASAMADNAWDDARPLPGGVADVLAEISRSVTSHVLSATECSSTEPAEVP